jgi:hypothetical protein
MSRHDPSAEVVVSVGMLTDVARSRVEAKAGAKVVRFAGVPTRVEREGGGPVVIFAGVNWVKPTTA